MDKEELEKKLEFWDEKITGIEFMLDSIRRDLDYIEEICTILRSNLWEIKEEINKEEENVDIN